MTDLCAAGIETIVARPGQAGASRVVLESIGGDSLRVARALASAAFDVGVVDPKRDCR